MIKRCVQLVVVFIVTAGFTMSIAWASLSSTTSASMTITSATLQPPTSLTAVFGTCTIHPAKQSVNLSWTATSSTFADGYEILRSTTSGGPYTSLGTVSGQSTVAYTDSTVAASTTYYYVVQSTKSNWLSVNSNQASVATKTVLCV
ncbi:MAG: hypothetical protein ACYDCC_00055 [Actinomycetota bacterium]